MGAAGQAARLLVSRLAMLTLGAALLFGGWQCLRWSHRISEEDWARRQQFHEHRPSNYDDGSQLPFGIGITLAVFGVAFVLGGVLPAKVLYRMPFFAEPGDGRALLEEMFR